jgi:ribonucleoside-diphosphate reductase alpha chain
MDCDTTGIEPDYALVKFKKLAGGGYFKIINQSIPPALEKLGYNKTEIKDIIDYCVGTGSVKGAPGISEKSLRNKGFGDEELAVIENGLQNSVYLEPAFFPGRFSKSFLEQKIGLPESTWSLPGFSLLKHLGYSEEDIGKTEEYACGAMTMEGAPHLKKADLAVFDTASAAGRRACRSIPWKAHIEMMAAVQPFVSGAISKTINMPSSSGVEDVHNAYFLAWKRMLKAIALYRDGSKLSQPLLAIQSQNDRLAAQLAALAKSAASGTEQQKQGEVPQRATAKHIHKRIPLPSRRTGYTQKAKIGTHSLFLRTGEYSDGRLGEIFLDMHKEGAAFRSLLNSFAIAVSLGLQYGVPLEEYVDAFTFTRFEPNGIVRGHDNIKMSTSVLDFIFRDLALTYLGRTDLVQVSPEDLIATGTDRDGDEKKEDRRGDKAAKAGPMPSKKRENGTESGGNGKDEFKGSAREASYAQARIMGYEGDPCVTCGNFTMVRNGTCLKCDTCGSTSGCS